jgi:hypothetical protein
VLILSNSISIDLLDKAMDRFAYCPLPKNIGSAILGLDKACPRRRESTLIAKMDARLHGHDNCEKTFLTVY